MKKITLWLLALFCTTLPALADHNRSITREELPRAARELLDRHFQDLAISYASVDRSLFERDYKVILDDGTSLDFDRHGAWTEIERPRAAIPEALIPETIRKTVATRFEQRPIRKIERTRHGWEVELKGGIDLDFDHRFRLTKVDD